MSTPTERLQAAGEGAARLLDEIGRAEAAHRYGDALVLADSLVHMVPELPEGHFRRGLLLLRFYQLDAADESFTRAAGLDPYHRGALYQRGHVSFERGQYREAASRYLQQREVILESPAILREYYESTDRSALPQAWLQVGRAYQLLHNADSSRWAYEQVLALDSTHAQANAWLSELYQEQGELEMALKLARRALDSDRRNPDFAYAVGTLLFRTGRIEKALPILEWTASMQPWSAGVHYNLGRVLIAMGRTDEGEKHLELTDVLQDLDQEIDQARAAAARFPNDPARWRAVAELLGQAGRRAEQRETLSIARAVAKRAGAAPSTTENNTAGS